jgi:hypothetical protein
MAEFIPRDLSTPFDPADLDQIAEFEGFACSVPDTTGMIDAVNGVVGATRANIARAAKLFVPALVTGLPAGVADFPTPDVIAPTPGATFERRGLHNQDLNVPLAGGGTTPVEMWSFESRVQRGVGDNTAGWPGRTIRAREGEIVHSVLGTRSGPHTIHHHGIEPTPMNDGVGHLTFEVTGGLYAYQWLAAESGTYFYHCHRNTVLHFEAGMYGMLIIDPDVPGAPFIDGGPGVTLVGDTPTAYHREAIWVADDIDTRWHGIDQGDSPGDVLFNGTPVITNVAAGVQACDLDGRSGFVRINDAGNPRLHDFRPNVFVVSGQAAPAVDNGQNLIAAAGATLAVGQRLLVRALNASYCNQVWKFPTTLQGTVTATDGRTHGRSGFGSYSQPFALAGIGHQFILTTARRHDVLIDAATATFIGQHLVEIEFRHWITNALLRTVRVPITVTP